MFGACRRNEPLSRATVLWLRLPGPVSSQLQGLGFQERLSGEEDSNLAKLTDVEPPGEADIRFWGASRKRPVRVWILLLFP